MMGNFKKEGLYNFAGELFAGGTTGFSGPQIISIFQKYDSTLQFPFNKYGKDFPTRKLAFIENLKSFPENMQITILQDLCLKDDLILIHNMKYQIPSKEDRSKILKLVQTVFNLNPTNTIKSEPYKPLNNFQVLGDSFKLILNSKVFILVHPNSITVKIFKNFYVPEMLLSLIQTKFGVQFKNFVA